MRFSFGQPKYLSGGQGGEDEHLAESSERRTIMGKCVEYFAS